MSSVEVWRDAQGIPSAYGYVSAGCAWVELPNVAKFRFRHDEWSVTAFAHANADSDLIADSYLRAALPMVLHFFGYEVLHASAVRTRLGIVPFCAVSETGKSTTAAALSMRGHSLWADDALALNFPSDDAAPSAVHLPFKPRLRPMATASLGPPKDLNCWRGSGGFAASSEPLAALCILSRDAELACGVEISPLTGTQAFATILPHAHYFSLRDPERKGTMLRRYLELSAKVPAFMVRFVPGLDRLPEVVTAIEQTIPGFRP